MYNRTDGSKLDVAFAKSCPASPCMLSCFVVIVVVVFVVFFHLWSESLPRNTCFCRLLFILKKALYWIKKCTKQIAVCLSYFVFLVDIGYIWINSTCSPFLLIFWKETVRLCLFDTDFSGIHIFIFCRSMLCSFLPSPSFRTSRCGIVKNKFEMTLSYFKKINFWMSFCDTRYTFLRQVLNFVLVVNEA